jgi:hypothetical protein
MGADGIGSQYSSLLLVEEETCRRGHLTINLKTLFAMRAYMLSMLFLIISCNQNKPDWIDRTKHEGLERIYLDQSFEVYTSQSNPDHIENTLQNLEQAKSYYDQTFNEDINFAVLFIDNQNWKTYAFAPPPGMPQAYYKGNMVLGLGKSVMASRWEEGLKRYPQERLDSLRMLFGDEIDLDLFFRDALSLHELGHLYQFYKTGEKSQRRWLNEMFGNLCQVAASKNLEDKNVFNRMDYFQLFLLRENLWGELSFSSLDEFENSYFEIIEQGRNYGWYQTQFFIKAKLLYANFGDSFLNDFRNFIIENDPDKVGEINDVQLTQKMREAFGDEAMEILKWEM